MKRHFRPVSGFSPLQHGLLLPRLFAPIRPLGV